MWGSIDGKPPLIHFFKSEDKSGRSIINQRFLWKNGVGTSQKTHNTLKYVHIFQIENTFLFLTLFLKFRMFLKVPPRELELGWWLLEKQEVRERTWADGDFFPSDFDSRR